MKWFLGCLKKYGVFRGRASRTEFWMFVLISLIITAAIEVVFHFTGSTSLVLIIISYLFTLVTILPFLAVTARRLHDVGKSGMWIFFFFAPIVGPIVLLVLLCKQGDAGPNDFGGPAPLQ